MCLFERGTVREVVCTTAVGTRPSLRLFGNQQVFNVQFYMTKVPLKGRVTSC